MAERRVAVDRVVDAPAGAAWNLLSDYREGHPSILPRPWFEGIDVEEGGRGAGTVFTVRMRPWGRTKAIRMRVSEPEPGRVLEEVGLEDGVRTTFTVDPLDGGARCRVTIATAWPPKNGVAARVEWWMIRAGAPRIFRAELDLLAKRLERGAGPAAPPGTREGA